jgi:hypothetical protein
MEVDLVSRSVGDFRIDQTLRLPAPAAERLAHGLNRGDFIRLDIERGIDVTCELIDNASGELLVVEAVIEPSSIATISGERISDVNLYGLIEQLKRRQVTVVFDSDGQIVLSSDVTILAFGEKIERILMGASLELLDRGSSRARDELAASIKASAAR